LPQPSIKFKPLNLNLLLLLWNLFLSLITLRSTLWMSFLLLECNDIGAWQACAAGLEKLRALTAASNCICVVASVGTRQIGKSMLLSRLVGQTQLFASNRSSVPTTTNLSVWASISTVSSSALPPAASSARTSTVLVALDAQGFQADKDDEIEMKLLTILTVVCDVLLWSVDARLEASDVAKMGGLRSTLDVDVPLPQILLLVCNEQLKHAGDPSQYFSESITAYEKQAADADVMPTNVNVRAAHKAASFIKSAIRTSRSTWLFATPVDGEAAMARVAVLPDARLKPQFLAQIAKLRDYILTFDFAPRAFFSDGASLATHLERAIDAVNSWRGNAPPLSRAAFGSSASVAGFSVAPFDAERCCELVRLACAEYLQSIGGAGIAQTLELDEMHKQAISAAKGTIDRLCLANGDSESMRVAAVSILDVCCDSLLLDRSRMNNTLATEKQVMLTIVSYLASIANQPDADGALDVAATKAAVLNRCKQPVRDAVERFLCDNDAVDVFVKRFKQYAHCLSDRTKRLLVQDDRIVHLQQELRVEQNTASQYLKEMRAAHSATALAVSNATKEQARSDAERRNIAKEKKVLEKEKTVLEARVEELERQLSTMTTRAAKAASSAATTTQRLESMVTDLQTQLARSEQRANTLAQQVVEAMEAVQRARQCVYTQNCNHRYAACKNGSCAHECCKR
jgi:hypothetical protein